MVDILGIPVDFASTLTAGSVGLVWIGRIIWRRWSKDVTEVAKDRAEVSIIDTMLSQIATLSEENLRLRKDESDLSIRLGRLESKEKEAEELIRKLERAHTKLDEKDKKIEELIIKHTEENTKLLILLGIKDNEIKELNDRVATLVEKVKNLQARKSQ